MKDYLLHIEISGASFYRLVRAESYEQAYVKVSAIFPTSVISNATME